MTLVFPFTSVQKIHMKKESQFNLANLLSPNKNQTLATKLIKLVPINLAENLRIYKNRNSAPQVSFPALQQSILETTMEPNLLDRGDSFYASSDVFLLLSSKISKLFCLKKMLLQKEIKNKERSIHTIIDKSSNPPEATTKHRNH